MKIQRMELSRLKGADYNPRKDLTPDDPEFQKLQRTMEEFGYVEPIIWNQTTGRIVGGHQRVKALLHMGVKEEDVVVIEANDREEKILNILLNRTKGRWDNDKLAALMKELEEADAIDLTGFDEWEVQGLIEGIDRVADILDYQPPGEDDGEAGEDKEPMDEPEYFSMSFSIPHEYEADINLYLATEDEAGEHLATAIVNHVKGVA